MTLREIFRFEVSHQSRRIWTWLSFAVLLGLTFQLATEGYIDNARSGGYFFNAPLPIAAVTLLAGLMGLLMATALAGDAGARDVQTRMHPLLYTAPVGKAAYLGGRFLAAFMLSALILLAVPVGLLLALLSPGLEAELIGPFRPAAYVGAYLFIALPNAFVATALLFSMAALSGRAVVSYLGGALLFFASMLNWQFVAIQLGRWDLAKLLDPFGLTVMSEMAMTWTPIERNTQLIGLEGSLLWNRLLWLGIALGVLALTHLRFRFAHHTSRSWRGRGARRRGAYSSIADAAGNAASARGAPTTVPLVRRRFGFATHTRQTAAVAWRSFLETVTSWGGLALVALAVFLVLIGPEAMDSMGVPLFPTTEQLTRFIGGSQDLIGMIIPLLIIFYAGELVWRERDTGVSEIADAAPVPDWMSFLGKFLALGLVLLTLQMLLTIGAMLVQVRLGYSDLEIGLYLRILFGFQFAGHLLFALLALVVHVLANQKYVGHMVVLIAHAFMAFAPALGIEHNLLVYGSDPGWEYSDMRGFGPFLGPWLWFKLYWAAWALLLAVAARLLWVRGREQDLQSRLKLARRRFTRPAVGAAAAAAGLILALGGFVFYNTNVLNEYRTASDGLEQRAEYERRYGRYEGNPQPLLTGTRLHVEIYPAQREVEIRGTYSLMNRSAVGIDSIHVAAASGVETGAVRFDRPATRVLADEALGHRIYVLGKPLQPGESMRLNFEVRFDPRGFPNRGIDASVAANGTYFVAQQWLPAIGYQLDRELDNAADRRAQGLPARPGIRSLDDEEARRDVAERVTVEAVMGTDESQTAVAPGRLRRTWTKDGRRYFHYATDAPIRNDYAFYSAAYAVHEGQWNDVAIQIFHHPDHAWNVDRMLRSLRASLDYFTEQFGPYPHGQIRLVEHPGPGSNTLHAAPINVSYREGFSLFNPDDDPRDLDFPFAVVAHEVAHQWWGNQLIPARVEGRGVLTESLAWFSAMGVVEETYGREHLRRFLSAMREAYLTPRARGGVPLLRAYDWFQAYRKGPFAMYALREYVGEEQVNAALRRLLEQYGSGEPPLPTSLDLYRELQAVTPDSLHYLLHDLFEANTFWELETEAARAEPTAAGAWRVTLDVQARKVVVDTVGLETEVPMDGFIEVGVFAAAEDGGPGAPLYLRMHRIRSGEQRITITLPTEPARAGIDPRNLLIDVEPDDNLTEVRRSAALPLRAGRGIPADPAAPER